MAFGALEIGCHAGWLDGWAGDSRVSMGGFDTKVLEGGVVCFVSNFKEVHSHWYLYSSNDLQGGEIPDFAVAYHMWLR